MSDQQKVVVTCAVTGVLTNPAQHPVPVTVEQTPRPCGHGYVQAHVDRANPFLPECTSLCGHEFHYSKLVSNDGELDTVMAVKRSSPHCCSPSSQVRTNPPTRRRQGSRTKAIWVGLPARPASTPTVGSGCARRSRIPRQARDEAGACGLEDHWHASADQQCRPS